MENPPPVRAPYDENEGYKPLRKPKSAASTPTHSKALSPDAREFTPSNATTNSFHQDRLQHQQRFQQQHNQQNYPQFQQNKSYHHQQQQLHHLQHHNDHFQQQQQQQQQHHHHNQHHHHHSNHHNQHQRYNGYNGVQQMVQHQHPQHQNLQQIQHQQQPQQQYYSPIPTSNIQGRLKINKSGNAENSAPFSPNAASTSKNTGSSNNYNNYNQRHRNPHQQQQQNHHHDQHQSYQNSGAGAAAATPHQATAVEVETIALDYLQTVIQCLNQNPGQFDTIATRFLTIFDGMENNDYVLSNAMEDIFQESIQKPNFRYMGAKLYNLLHMLNLKKDSLFHMLLKCKLDYHQNELVQYMKQPNQQPVRETALFLAELYMQLRGDDSRIHLIAENIVFALKQLLSKESNDNVRCICLTLKLAGYDLTSDCPKDMQEIIYQLEAINSKNPGKYPLAANVISLQKNNWGRKISSSNSMCEDEEKLKQPEPLRTSDEPIFYGPDGRELTAEESDFLTSHVSGGAEGGLAGAGGGSTDEEDIQDLDVDLDPEMDEETERAYKEFCKLKPSS